MNIAQILIHFKSTHLVSFQNLICFSINFHLINKIINDKKIKRLDNTEDKKTFLSEELNGIWIYKPLNFFRNKRVRIINDIDKFKQDFLEKQKQIEKSKENNPIYLLKKKTMSAGYTGIIGKPQKTLTKKLTTNGRMTLLQNLNNFKFQVQKNNLKLPAIKRSSSIKKNIQVSQLPPLKHAFKEIEEDSKKEYVFKYKYLSSKAIFQKYIERPFLYENRKCELRF